MGLFDGFKRKKDQQAETPFVVVSNVETKEDAPVGASENIQAEDAETVDSSVENVAERTEQAEEQGTDSGTEQADQEISAADSATDDSAEEDESDEVLQEMPSPKATPIKSYSEKAPVTHAIGETKIIAIINQKGGVGKSTTAINLGAALGVQDKAVLVVDLDPQGNTTSGLGVDKGQIQQDVYEILLGEKSAEEVIIPDVCPGLDLIPATINLAGAEVELVNEMARENRLKNALGALRGKYDYIFIDCPPALGLLTVNALVASDKLLIPIQCEFYALEGVTKLLDSMKRVKNVLNPALDTFGVLLTMYDGRTMLARQVAEEVRNFFGSKVFETIIPRTVRLSEAPSFGQPITEYDPKGKGAQAYMNLAKEVINRG